MNFIFRVGFILLSVNFLLADAIEAKDKCEKCVLADQCLTYGNMRRSDQKKWLKENACRKPLDDDLGPLFGFAPLAKGDYVCCPGTNVWETEVPNKNNNHPNIQDTDQDEHKNDPLFNHYKPDEYDQGVRNADGDIRTDSNDGDNITGDDEMLGGGYEQSRGPHHHHRHPGPFDNNPSLNSPYGNNPSLNGPYGNNPNLNGPYGTKPNLNRPYGGNNPNLNGPYANDPNFNRPYGGNNPNYNDINSRNGQIQRPFNINNNGQNNPNGGASVGEQCKKLTGIPPAPESGCCGLDLSIANRIVGQQNGFLNKPSSNSNQWTSQSQPWSNGRFTRSADDDTVPVSLDSRITGGKETELEQFPWTVLLKITFDDGNKKSAFNCGGSLISARYILTAAHCVTDESGKVSDVEVNLAEYDRRTFPRDCVNVPGQGKKCIDNVVMHAEKVIVHPGYDDSLLQSDIALIRLDGYAPYTDFIRPICLPPIDVDQSRYSDLRLAVAGWGRNKQFTSQVKQSTVVNLVPQRECSKSYPQLTRKHLCAAGHSGEDTCKGDSGGPLMMLFGGKQYVSGVVSGKRADAPCGTAVPSLYTNVFSFIDWIRENVRK